MDSALHTPIRPDFHIRNIETLPTGINQNQRPIPTRTKHLYKLLCGKLYGQDILEVGLYD
jgi:hypothetical protein